MSSADDRLCVRHCQMDPVVNVCVSLLHIHAYEFLVAVMHMAGSLGKIKGVTGFTHVANVTYRMICYFKSNLKLAL